MGTPPTTPPRQAVVTLGRFVKFARETAGIRQADLAATLGYSTGWLSNVETGQLKARRDQIAAIEVALKMPDGSLTEIYDQLNREHHPVESFDLFAKLERSARTIQDYESLAMPGLLQTEDTARALLSAGRPTDSPDVIDELVAMRMERQLVLTQDTPPKLWIVLDEPVIRRPVGGRDVHRKQLDHLLQAAEQPGISVQAIPFDTGAHAGLVATFHILGFETGPDIAYSEDPATGHILERPELVRAMSDAYNALRLSVLPMVASVELIKKIREE